MGLPVNYNNYAYHQNIPSANEVLRYSGKSASLQAAVSRLAYRDQSHKTTLNLRVYRKYSTNAVNDIAIEQQRRRTAGWEFGVNQHSYLGSATLDANSAGATAPAHSAPSRRPRKRRVAAVPAAVCCRAT